MSKEGMIKHREVLNAWLDGVTVEEWNSIVDGWLTTSEPSFLKGVEYRIKPTPIKHTVTRWFNIYENDVIDYMPHKTKAEADDMRSPKRSACVSVEFKWTEGEGLLNV